MESLKEECGLFGICGHSEAAKLVYLGLYALQHRGQESAGIVSSSGKKIYRHAGMGLVADVFSRDTLNKLRGTCAIGHVRYSTAGDTSIANAQPLLVTIGRGTIAIGHNGNLTNAVQLKKNIESEGAIFQTNSDSEIILHLLARSKHLSIEKALQEALREVRGAYSLLLATRTDMFAVRDPFGIRPLALGKRKGACVIASETCAFDLINAEYVRDIEPGEILRINEKGISSFKFAPQRKPKHCIFEYIYFSRPDSKVFGRSVYLIRREMGRQLAREAEPKVDFVMPVPDSAVVSAIGFAEEANVPYEMGFIRSHYIGRTFIEPNQSIRDFGAKIKYNPIKEVLRGKRIALIDDSIVRGTTSLKLIRMLRAVGAKEVHFYISSPPITHPCFYGIDTPTKKELIASSKSIPQIQRHLNVDSLHYLSLPGLIKATDIPADHFCTSCFTGCYI